jgi:hypothetical protein
VDSRLPRVWRSAVCSGVPIASAGWGSVGESEKEGMGGAKGETKHDSGGGKTSHLRGQERLKAAAGFQLYAPSVPHHCNVLAHLLTFVHGLRD